MKDFYKIIGVDYNADSSTIKNAYLLKIKKYHPDHYTGDKSFAEQKTMELNEAYDTLKDEDLKKQYDLKLGKVNKKLEKKTTQTSGDFSKYSMENSTRQSKNKSNNSKNINKNNNVENKSTSSSDEKNGFVEFFKNSGRAIAGFFKNLVKSFSDFFKSRHEKRKQKKHKKKLKKMQKKYKKKSFSQEDLREINDRKKLNALIFVLFLALAGIILILVL